MLVSSQDAPPGDGPSTGCLAARPLRVFYAGTLPPHPGGSAIGGGGLLRSLAAAGVEIAAVAPWDARQAGGGDTFALDHPEIRVARYLVPHVPVDYSQARPPLPSLRDERRRIGLVLDGLLARRGLDLVLCGRESFAWTVPSLAAARGLPCLQIAHGLWAPEMLAREPVSARAVLLRRVLAAADRIVLVANHQEPLYRQAGFDNIAVVQNGVDLERFAPAPRPAALARRLGIDRSDVVALHASNLKSLKRPLDIVWAAARALRHDARLLFLIVGDGRYRAAMELAVRRLGLERRFRFSGWVEHADMPQYLRLADLVVMPSEAEALSMVFLETMASGRLLVASDIPAARELVTPGVTGLLFPPRDVDPMVALLVRAAGDPAWRSAMGARAREAARALSLARMRDGYLAVMESVVESRRAGSGMEPLARTLEALAP